MKRLGCFGMIIVLLLAVIAYDQWKIYQLKNQMASIATKVHAAKGSKAPAKNTDLASTLAQAQAYTKQAQKFLSNKNVVQAQQELKKAKQKLDSASSVSKNIYENSTEFLGKARVRTEKVFKEAWKDISSEQKPKQKPEIKERKSSAGKQPETNN